MLTAATSALFVGSEGALAFDFVPRYVGAQAFWSGESPYRPAVTTRIQEQMFGSALPPGFDEQRFAHPAYTAVILAPLLLLDAPRAISLWMALQLLCLLMTPIVWLYVLDLRPKPLVFAALLVGLVFVFRYPINTYLVGQFTGSMVLLISLAMGLLRQKRDTLAGVALAFSTVPPNIALPLAMLLLVGYGLRGRWRALAAFLGVLFILTAISLARIGWWLPDFVDGVRAYTEYSFPVWALSLLPAPLAAATLALVVGVPGFAIYTFRAHPTVEAELRLFALAILCALLLIPQTGNYYLVLLIPVFMIGFYQARHSRLLTLLLGLVLVSPWLYLRTPGTEVLMLPLSAGVTYLMIVASQRFSPYTTASLQPEPSALR